MSPSAVGTLPEEAPTVPNRQIVVTALGVTQILAWGSSYYLPAVLAKPIAADTGWPLAIVVGGLSLGLIASGLVAPHVGRTVDRVGGRPVLALSSVLIAAGQLLLSCAGSPAPYMLGWLVLGAGLYDAAFATLGRLYGGDARRAITMLTLWGGFASTVCWPLSAFLVEALGWRATCLAYACLQLGVSLPIHLTLIPRVAVSPGLIETAPRAGDVPADRRPRRALVLLGAILVLGAMISSVVSVHLLTVLQARGLDLAAAVALGALIGPAQVASRVVEMATGTRFHPIWTMLASTVGIMAGLALLLAGWPLPGLALVLYGAGNGLYSIARGTLPLALFGPAGYATLLGRLAMPALLASALSPSLGALLIELGGADLAVATLVGAAAVNVGLVLVLNAGRPAAPGRRRLSDPSLT